MPIAIAVRWYMIPPVMVIEMQDLAPADTSSRIASLQDIGQALWYQRGLQKIGAAFADAGIAPVVVKGQALVDLVYPPNVLRPANDIDLLVPGDQEAVVGVLTSCGYQEQVAAGRPYSRHVMGERLFLARPHGYPPVELHGFLDKMIKRPIDYTGIDRRARAGPHPGLRYPAIEDLLLLVMLHASYTTDTSRERILDDLQHLLARGAPDLDLARSRAVEWELAVVFDTWMGRLHRARRIELGFILRRDRSRLCDLFEVASDRLTPGWRYFVGQLPWYDRVTRHLRGTVSYALLRAWDRLARQ